jgi:hypothetical protein
VSLSTSSFFCIAHVFFSRTFLEREIIYGALFCGMDG